LAAGTHINDGCRFGETVKIRVKVDGASTEVAIKSYKVVRASLGCISSKGFRTSFATDKT